MQNYNIVPDIIASYAELREHCCIQYIIERRIDGNICD